MKWILEFLRRLANLGEDHEPISDSPPSAQAITEEPSFERPRIALFDVSNDVSASLATRGYRNVRLCSFGSAYIDPTPSEWVRPILNARVAVDFADCDLFVVDMSTSPPRKELRELRGGTPASVGMRRTTLAVDPRPLAMRELASKLDRTWRAGGVFVVFVDQQVRLTVATDPTYVEFSSGGEEVSTWAFLPVLDYFNVRNETGREMRIVGGPEKLQRLLTTFLSDSSYHCTFEPIRFHGRDEHLVPGWEVLATDRFGVPVAGLVRDESNGLILLLPRVDRLPAFVAALVADALPTAAPHLYPHFERLEWTTIRSWISRHCVLRRTSSNA